MKNQNKKLERFYDKVYHKGEGKHFTNLVVTGKTSEEYTEVLKEINWKGKRILEVGCGTGNFAYQVAKKGGKILAIDYSDEAIKLARNQYKHTNLEYEKFDVNKKINEKFDVIVSIGTMEHMDNPFEMLKKFKRTLNQNGKIIITSPNWVNPRGYMLLTLYYLFEAPITLADLHYLTPIEFDKWAKKLGMKLKWRTIDKSWAHGDILVEDFKRRIPNVLKDTNLKVPKKNISNFIEWIQSHVTTMDNNLQHSGATGLYVLQLTSKK